MNETFVLHNEGKHVSKKKYNTRNTEKVSFSDIKILFNVPRGKYFFT